MRSRINNIDTICQPLRDAGLRDEAHETQQTLLENALGELVTALQRYAERIYEDLGIGPRLRQNAFQNLDTLQKNWTGAFGESLKEWLSEKEYSRMVLLYERRHKFQHTQGIVDEKYLKVSGDTSYKIGQRIVCGEADVRELVELVSKVGHGIRKGEADLRKRKTAPC